MTTRSLTQLPRDLKRQFGVNVSYRSDCYKAAVDGKIPAEQGQNGRWTYKPEDVPQIAAALGLMPSNQTAVAA